MSTPSRPIDAPPSMPAIDPASLSGLPGLAELAFGSLTRANDISEGQHLALLHAESLELDPSDPAQRQFGDYELLELLGEGGMGVVYRARHLPLDREVAIKLLSAGPWASKDFIARFEREAQNAARMQHPNIVTVYEAGSHDGLQFMAMRLIDGRSLSSMLKRGDRFTPRQAAELLRTVAEAVGYAHSLGVLHLDLKPGNVLIGVDGVPHVADFGLARRLDSAAVVANDEVSGTPSYMAPEQARVRSSRLTAATDVWGLGAILYELLTGQPPFRADTAQATLKLVLEGHVRAPRRACPSLPLDLQAIVLRCLARDPRERYPTARALADDLARFVEGRPVQARPLNNVQRIARWTRREPRLAAMALLAFALLAGGLLATTQQWFRADRNAATASARLWESRNAASLDFMESGNGWQAAPLLLANLTEMEAQGDSDGASGMRKRLGVLVNQHPRLIDSFPVQGRPAGMAFSPDGSRLAVSGEDTGVRLFDVDSGRELMVAMPREGQGNGILRMLDRLQFAPDGKKLTATAAVWDGEYVRPTAMSMLRLDTARGTWIDPPAAFADFLDASYGTDGRYALLTDKAGRVQFWATGPWRALGPLGKLPDGTGPGPRLIAPSGDYFVLPGPTHAARLVDARSLALRAKVELGEFDDVTAWAISPDSRWVALGDGAGHVKVVDATTGSVRTLQPRPFFGAQWITFSDDGAWLAVAAGAGGVHLWSWPEGRLLVPPFSGNPSAGGEPQATHVELDRTRNLVLTSDPTLSSALWQVAPTESELDRTEAVPITARINAIRRWGAETIAWDRERGLLASITLKRVRIERLPPPVLKTGRGARLMPDTLRFDGQHLVEVDGSSVSIVDAADEQKIGTPFRFAQAPTFAELTGDGATLVVVSGRTLHAFEAASGKPRFAPIQLENAPAHVDLAPDGQRVVTTWLRRDEAGERNFSEVAEIHDLASGQRVGGPEPLPGMLKGIAFSPDGRHLLAWNARELTLRDGTTLAPVVGALAKFRVGDAYSGALDVYMPVAAFDPDGHVELAIGWKPSKDTDWKFELRRYADDGTFRTSKTQPEPWGLVPLPRGGTAVLSAYVWSVIVPREGSMSALPDPTDDNHRFVGAVSPDGRWFARVRRDGVTVFDLHDRSRIATLRAALPRPDEVWQLAFSPDGNRLLARSLRGRYIVWDLTPDPRPVAVIAREIELRNVDVDSVVLDEVGPDPGAAERASLRARDPGLPPAPHAPPAVAVAGGFPGGAIAPRDPTTPATALDLGAFYDFGIRNPFAGVVWEYGDFSWLPGGTQRLLGTEFDIRGGVRLAPLAAAGGITGGPGTHSVIELAVPAGRVAAIRMLTYPVGGRRELTHFADVRFDYVDGSHASVPAGFVDGDFAYWRKTASGGAATSATYGWDARGLFGDGRRFAAMALRVANPEPDRPLAGVVLAAPAEADVAQVILAVTVEPVAADDETANAKSHDQAGG